VSWRARNAFVGAGICAGLLPLVWFLAFHVGFVEHADQSIFLGFRDLGRGPIPRLARHVARLCDPKPYTCLALVPVAVALLRRRRLLAVTLAVILLSAPGTTELIKPLLAQTRPHSLFGDLQPVGPVSWPSGHATAAMSLALTAVLAVPARFRPAMAALGALFAIAVSYSFLTLGWHYPSDVFGGFLVAATWTLLGVGGLLASDAGRRRAPAEEAASERHVSIKHALAPAWLAVVAGGIVMALVLAIRPHEVINYAQAHKAFVVGAAAIGAAGMALATGIMLAVRR
jgi:membrane-associated phospholipid phosphatase